MSEEQYKQIFSRNLRYYMSLNNKSQTDLINDLGFNKSAVSTWCNGTRLPRMDKVDALAKYFGIKRSELIEERKPDTAEPPQQEAADELDDSEQFLIDVYRDLNEEGKDRLVDYADDLHSMDKYKKGDKSIPASA